MRYRDGYKYQLVDKISILTGIVGRAARIVDDEGHALAELTQGGWLIAHADYAWDGPSGPTIDSPSAMKASLFHDILYQMMREGHLEPDTRKEADELFYDLCIRGGMWKWRAKLWYFAIRNFAAYAAKRGSSEVKTAP